MKSKHIKVDDDRPNAVCSLLELLELVWSLKKLAASGTRRNTQHVPYVYLHLVGLSIVDCEIWVNKYMYIPYMDPVNNYCFAKQNWAVFLVGKSPWWPLLRVNPRQLPSTWSSWGLWRSWSSTSRIEGTGMGENQLKATQKKNKNSCLSQRLRTFCICLLFFHKIKVVQKKLLLKQGLGVFVSQGTLLNNLKWLQFRHGCHCINNCIVSGLNKK